MNKFTYTKNEFADTLLYTAILTILVKFASNISNTPVYMSMFIISTVAFIVLFYFSFFEKRREILDKWLAKSSMMFLGLSFLSILALGDYFWFGIE